MPSAAQKGAYYQSRSKKWLEAQGYVVEPLQLMAWINTGKGWRPIKRDAFASDLLAVSIERTVFAQIKGGESCRTQRAAARTAFLHYPLSAGAEQWLILWMPRAREPEVEVVRSGPCAPEVWTEPPAPRRKAKKLPLFEKARAELR